MKKKLIRFFTRQSIASAKKAENSLSVANDIETKGDTYTVIMMFVMLVLSLVSFAGLALVFTWAGLTVLQLFAGVVCWFFLMTILRIVVILLS